MLREPEELRELRRYRRIAGAAVLCAASLLAALIYVGVDYVVTAYQLYCQP